QTLPLSVVSTVQERTRPDQKQTETPHLRPSRAPSHSGVFSLLHGPLSYSGLIHSSVSCVLLVPQGSYAKPSTSESVSYISGSRSIRTDVKGLPELMFQVSEHYTKVSNWVKGSSDRIESFIGRRRCRGPRQAVETLFSGSQLVGHIASECDDLVKRRPCQGYSGDLHCCCYFL